MIIICDSLVPLEDRAHPLRRMGQGGRKKKEKKRMDGWMDGEAVTTRGERDAS